MRTSHLGKGYLTDPQPKAKPNMQLHKEAYYS